MAQSQDMGIGACYNVRLSFGEMCIIFFPHGIAIKRLPDSESIHLCFSESISRT